MKRGALFGSAKDVTLIAAMSATLIAAQYALQMVAGVEIVTALFSAYCFVFGVRRGLTVATCFSMLRCFLYGFTLSVIALYLIYFNLFALVFGLLGKATAKFSMRAKLFCAAACAAMMTVCFTLLDDVLAPLIVGVRFWPYFYASLPVMAVQTVCALITVSLLFLPLDRAFGMLKGAHPQADLHAEESCSEGADSEDER